MNVDFLLQDFLETVGYNLPALLAMVAGMVATVASWQRHPLAARWAFLGFAWLFVVGLVSIAWRTIGVVLVFPHAPGSWEEITSYVFLSILESLAYISFIVAFNVARQPYRRLSHYDEFSEDDGAK